MSGAGWAPLGDKLGPGAILFAGVTVPTVSALFLLLVGTPRWRRRPGRLPRLPSPLVPRADTVIELIIAGNRRAVLWTLANRLRASGLAFAMLLTVIVPMSKLELAAFGAEGDNGRVEFAVKLDADFTLSEAEQQMRIYEDFLEERRDEWGFSNWNDRFDERGGSLSLYWDEHQESESTHAIERELRKTLPRLPGHELRFYDEENVGARDRTVATFTLRGTDSAELERLAASAVLILEEVQGLSGVSSTVEDVPDQLEVEIITIGGEIRKGKVFVTEHQRVVDVLNSDLRFIPIETEREEFEIINKSTIDQVKPIERRLAA